MLRYDVNSGPLTLIHDLRHLPKDEIDKLNATPRSLDQNLNNPTTTVGNFRKKGFVNYNFVRPRIPRTIPAPDLLPSSDDPKVDLKPPSPKKSVGSPQKSVASIPKSASPGKSTGLPSPIRAPASATKPGSKGSAQHSAMDGRRSHQSQRRDLTSRSSHNRLHQSDSAMGWARDRPSPRYDSRDNPLSYRSVNQNQGTGRNYSDEYDSTQNVPIRNAHQKSHEQIKKETQQFLDRREEERRFQEESELRKREKHEDQRRAREMMEESGPFGRPGAGAPNGNDYKKQKFREEQFQRDPPRYQVEPDRYVRDVENYRRHERPPEEKKKYYEDLKQQEQEKKMNGHTTNGAQNPEMAREADQGLDGMPPFHSPGRNGMPSERQRYDMTKENLQKLRMQNEMLERTSPGPQQMPDGYMKNRGIFQEFDPWGRGIGNPLRDSSGNVARYPFALGKPREGFGPNYGHFERDRRGISSPRSAPETDPKFLENPYDDLGRQKFTLKPSKIPPLEPWGPWGRSGGGAPRTDPKGNLITPIAGLMDRSSEDHFVRDGSFLNYKPDKKEEERMQEKINQRRYRSDLDLQVAQNARKGEEQQRHKNESQRDYAEIIDSRRRRPRSKNHLPRSDISLARDGTVRPNPIEAEKYRESLDVGSTEKEVDHKLNQLKDYQAARQHHEYFSSYWGRPGGGNRAHEKYTNKANLDRLLNNEQGPGRFSMKDVYVKGKDWSQFNEKEITPRFESQDDISPRYARVTVDSYHANQYDYPYTGPTGKKEYEMRSPWAQH
ncbi:trichohyalin-like isoform X4 [Argopecten irradians]|uniref:trichohyalin-like isoform X4 n=1 Tax=Argopecten irradians TaxID=31199 RepID=UPI003714CDB0